MNKARKVRDSEDYAHKVVEVLATEFDLSDETTSGIIFASVAANHMEPSDHLEVIVDDPMSANWRLKADLANPANVRLADYRMFAASPSERETRINTALKAI